MPPLHCTSKDGTEKPPFKCLTFRATTKSTRSPMVVEDVGVPRVNKPDFIS